MLPDQYTHQALEDVLTYDALSQPGHLQRQVLVLGLDVGPEQLHDNTLVCQILSYLMSLKNGQT
jgi:hypothetical protein